MSFSEHHFQSFFEKLEDRVLFDGVPDAAIVLPTDFGDVSTPVQSQQASLNQIQSSAPLELIIIDANVENNEALLQSLIESNASSTFAVHILDPDTDGVAQITELLAQSESKYQAVHILSHGQSGDVQLGSSRLSNSNVDQYVDQLASWSDALTDDADLLFYGCDLASNESGQSLIQTLSAATGADVAASDDTTGNQTATVDANWQLEFAAGSVEAVSLSAENWDGTLAIEATDGIVSIEDAQTPAAGTVTITNDGAAETVTTVGTPQRVGQMLQRVYQFDETGDVGPASFVFDVSGIAGINATIASEFGLIVSDQADFSGPNTTTLVASGYDAANGLVFFHRVDLSSGDYFGLATEVVQDNFTVSPAASGPEDTAIDLGLELFPALTDGGQLRDIIDTDTGFRSSTAGATPTEFLIPAGTTGIKITGFSTRDIGTGNAGNDATNDDYQRLVVSIDLDTELSNGFISHLIDQGPNRSDQFGWSGAPLGANILTGGGTVTGDANDNINPRFTVVDGVLQIVENHQLQTAYHVEFLTNATSSADFINAATGVRENGDQSDISLAVPANADFLVINIADAATSSNSLIEYKGNSRVYLDLATLRASGVVAAQRGETDNRVISYAFEDYDVSSVAVGSVLTAAGSVIGDTQETAGLLNDSQIYIDASGNLIINRENTFANNFDTLVTVEYYERKDVGSSAAQLGESTAFGLWNADPSNPDSILEFDIPENATLGILNLSMNGTRNSDTNENMGAGFAVIDLTNGTSSGSIYMVRAGGTTDLVGWDQTEFGTVFFDDPNSISNHATINQFVDRFAANAVFNLTNGGDTLELLTSSNAGTQSFLDYLVSGQIEWYGSAPLEISGFPADGTFDRGTFNPVTGNWDLTLEEAQAGLAYIPPAHVSGTSPVEVNLIIGDETETTSVRVEAVIDPISFDGIPDACGHEDTDISIAANITPTFIDQDGSETVTSLVLSNIPVGHTLTDGTNTFTATATGQSADITAWDQSSIVYRANPNQSGTFTIDIAVNWQDVGGGVTDTDSATASFDVVVKPANDIPVAVDNNYTVLGNTPLTVDAASGLLNNDTDADGDTLVVITTPVSGPSNGVVSLNQDGSYTYTPATGFSGTDSFVYQISDNNGGFATATAFIDVSEPVTGPLVAQDDNVTTNEETLININVTGNDDLPITGAFNIQSTTPPANGTILVRPNGTIDYVPANNFFGTDSFTYTLADASGRTSTATVNVTVLNTQDPPVANADSGSTNEDVTLANINILANDSDVDTDPLTVTMATAANGTVVINGDGTIDYTPNANFSGTDTVNYTISDGNGGFASSTVLVNVVPVADPPTSADQTVTVDEDSAYAFVPSDFAFADADVGDQLVTVRIDTLAADGQILFQGTPVTAGQVISLAEITAGRLSFVPDPDDFGNAYTTFEFSVSDGNLFQTTPNTMTVNVIPLQDPPVATDNTITVDEDSTGNPLGLAPPVDVDGDTLAITVTGLPALGMVFLSDGVTSVGVGDTLSVAQLTTLLYDAPAEFAGTDPGDFTYDVTDSIATDSGIVNIIITPVNDPPVIDLDNMSSGSDHADTFTEGGPAVPLADSSTTVIDVDDVAFPSLTIAIDSATVVDAGEEFLVIGGVDFSLDAATFSTTPVSVGGVDYDVTYSPAVQTLVVVRTDGTEMTAAEISGVLSDAAYRNDSVLPTTTDRVFEIRVNDGDDDSNIATSTISVLRDAQSAVWTITGDATVIDGNAANYNVVLSDALRSGETASVDLAINDIDTNAADHGTIAAAVSAAVASYAGPGSVAFDGTTLTFTSDGTGAMAPLNITLPTTPDGEFEGDEDFAIVLSNPQSTTGQTTALGAASVATTTIIDNTPAPTVTIGDGSAVEGSPVVFTVSLDIASFEDVVLNLAATSGSATAGTDFETTNFEFFDGTAWQSATAGTQVTLPAGTTSLQVRVDSVQDGDVEPDETFTLSASVLSGTVTNASDTATGTIVNDDVALISIDDVSVDEDNGTITFTVSLDQPATGAVAVDWATANGTATGGVDFTSASGTVTFPPATQTQTIVINITDDNVFEGPETFTVDLSNASGGTIVDAQGVGTIFDDGNGPNSTANDIPAISIDDVTATEDVDAFAVFTVSLSNPSTQATELSLALADGSATLGSDYGPGLEFFDGSTWQPVAGNVTIAAGDTSLQIRTAIIDDAVTDDNETFALIATRISGTTSNAGDTGTGTILDDPTPDTTLISITGDASVTEGDLANYNLALSNTPLTDVTVTFVYSGTAVSGVDYSGVASVTIPAGQTTGSFSIATIDDTLGEPLESFTIAIDTATGGSLEDLQVSPVGFSVTTDIVDDDTPSISITDVLVSEGADPFAQFTVELSNPTFEDIDFDIVASGITATGNGVDFDSLALEVFDGTVWVAATSTTIAAGETTIRLRTPINDDPLAEPVETFTVEVTVTGGTTLNPSDTGVGTIQDDTSDPETIFVAIAGPGSVVEGAATTDYTLTLRNGAGTPINAAEDVTVSLSYGGTAADGADFTSVATVVIPAGSDSATFTLPTVDDALFEGTESIVVEIESVAGGGFEAIGIDPVDDEVTTLIQDDADIPTVAINNVTAVEGTDNFAVFTIELSNLSVEDVNVGLALSDGTADGTGVDFGAVAAGNLQVFDGTAWVDATTATIAAGEFFVQVRTPIVDDVIDEPNEDYSLMVNVLSGTTTNLSVTGTGTIIDNDAAPEVTIGDAMATEGDPLVFNVTLSNPSSEAIVLDFSATDSTANNVSDYLANALEFSTDGGMTWIAAAGGTQVTIPANSNGVLVRVPTVEDVTLESTETIGLAIGSVVSGIVGNTTDTATGTIADDDVALVSITANDAAAGEPGDDGQFTVTLTQPSDSPTVIQYVVTGSATSGADFAPVSGSVTLGPGQTVATIDIAVIDDVLIEGNEDVTVTLTTITTGDSQISIDAANNVDTVVIADDDVATWALTGQATVNEGAAAGYQLNLRGTLAAGESVAVELSIADVSTAVNDYAGFATAVADAVAGYTGPGVVAWDGTTLTFTSDGTGEMAQLNIDLAAINDAIVEGPETFQVSLGSAGSSTGAAVGIDPGNTVVTTEIQDTIDAVGTSLDKATWSITGSASVNEGQSADYVITIDAELQAGENASVDVGLADVDTAPGDVASLVAAINAAVADYNSGAEPGSLTFDGTTLTFFSDGTGPMGDLMISLAANADGFLEGPEDFAIQLSNADSSTGSCVAIDPVAAVATTINAQPVAAQWSIGVDNGNDEGGVVQYNVQLSQSLGAGDSAAVDLTLTDVDTNAGDYADFVAAVNTAVAGYVGPGTVSFDGTTLTYTAVADGDAFAGLAIDLTLVDDVIVEGVETFAVGLSNADGPTGVNVEVSASNDSVITTINDTIGVGGTADVAAWMISGPAAGSEGTSVQYVVSLSGQLGFGETASVVIDLNDLTTTTADYDSIVAAATAAAAANADVTFDAATGTFTYTSPSDGATMADLVIDLGLATDAIGEGDEDFEVRLSAAGSTTGAAIVIGTADSVTTTIIDQTAPLVWAVSGPGTADEGDGAVYFVTLQGQLGAGETASVIIAANDVTTNAADYADFNAAVATAIAGRPEVGFDATTGRLTFTATADGDTLSPLIVDLGVTDDVFVEGSEQFSIDLTDAVSSTGAAVEVSATADSVLTEINDTQDLGGDADGPALWAITGDASVVEGASASYTISLSELFGAGESVAVDLALVDVDTASTDYLDFVAAVNGAVAAYAGDGTVSFDGTTLVFTAINDGDSMDDLSFTFATVDDLNVEGPEDFRIQLTAPATATGAAVGVDAAEGAVTTTIGDNDRATWTIAGDAAVAEGATARYTVSLDGTLQNGETATVALTINNVDTTSADYANFVAAVNTAISGRSDLAFDGTTLTFTSSGSPMVDLEISLPAIDDVLVEGDEDYSVDIASGSSTTGSDVVVGVADSVTTTIGDDDRATWTIAGDAAVAEGATARYTVSLDGTLQTGETATVALTINNVDTTSADYADFVAAVNTAISGRSDLAFDGTTLTFTSGGSPMADLVINLLAIDDVLAEGVEDYSVDIASGGSTTGSDVVVGAADSVTTTIGDNDAVQWGITGDSLVDEGGQALYTVSLDGVLQAGENSSVQLTLVEADTAAGDLENFLNAVSTAVAARPDLTFDVTTGQLTAIGTGSPTDDLVIALTARDDSFIEGPESFQIQLTGSTSTTGVATGINAAEDTVVTTINDTVGDGGPNERAVWSLAADQTVAEGAAGVYRLSLGGNLQAGEVVSVDLAISDVTTAGTDYGDFAAAVADAALAYAGPGSVTWDGTTICFTSDGTGPMADLSISLATVDDSFGEGPEDFLIAINNPLSSTGSAVAIDAAANDVTTTIDDSVGNNADVVTFNIVGDGSVDEGGTARYTVSTTGALGAGEDATVELTVSDSDTNAADYADFNAAIVAAVDDYNAGGNVGSVRFDGTTLTFTADADGQVLDGLVIELDAVDDPLAEGAERYQVGLVNAGSSTGVAAAVSAANGVVSTIINDTVGEGGPVDPGGQWSLTGDTVVAEGDEANYRISVTGNLQSGERTSVQIAIRDVDTTSSDYFNLSNAVAVAVASYNADAANAGSLNWDGTSLTFISDGSGPMSELVIGLGAVDDVNAEGPESFELSLAAASSSTGLTASLSPTENQVTTTIIDNDQPLWSITGPSIVGEGSAAEFVVSLDGSVQSGETVAVQIDLTNVDTDSDDYGDFVAAVVAAAAANPEVTFDPVTGTLEFTSSGDGVPMTDLVISLPITADGVSESPEMFAVVLTNATSNDGLMPAIDSANNTATVTINGSPVLQDDTEFTSINTPLISGVLGNDSDPDGDVLQVVAVNDTPIGGIISTSGGNVEFNSNGTYTYTPNNGFSGVDSFTYTVTDGAGNTETATVEISVNEAEIGVAKAVVETVVSAADPDNFDVTFVIVVENLGDVPLNQLVLLDDLRAMLGDTFVSALVPTVRNFSGTGTPPSINANWTGDTSQNILAGGRIDPGDRFEVSFTATIDPDRGGGGQGLSNQATASGQGINPDGTPMRNSSGTLAVVSDVSDQGTDADGENGNVATNDGIDGNDATQIVIADLGIAKSILGVPQLLANGNYVATFGVVVANTGTVDLASLSLQEDLDQQFGDAFVSVDGLQFTQVPTDPISNINLDENFDGDRNRDLMDGFHNNVLATGDSFAIRFTVEIDPRNITGDLNNQILGNGDAVDRSGRAFRDAAGVPLVATDLSDSGTDPLTSNPDSVDDTGISSDATNVVLPEIPLGAISGTVFVDENNNGVFDPGESGIEGVEINLTGSDVFGNAVDLTVLTDAGGNYVFEGLNAGQYEVFQFQPDGFTDGLDASPSAALIGNDRLAGLQLGFGQQLIGNNFGEVLSGTSGNPASLPPLGSFGGSLLSNRISDFLGGPGPIYSGVPIDSNGSPLSLDSGRAVAGGYATAFAAEAPAEFVAGDDACCRPVVTPDSTSCVTAVEVGQANGDVVPMGVVDEYTHGESGVCQSDQCESDSCDEAAECVSCERCCDCCRCEEGGANDVASPQRHGVLYRIGHWLRGR